jgi:hypothetical protein
MTSLRAGSTRDRVVDLVALCEAGAEFTHANATWTSPGSGRRTCFILRTARWGVPLTLAPCH